MRSPRSSSQRGFDTPTGPRRGSPAAILVRDRVSQARTRERPDRLRRRHFGPGTVTTRAGRRVPTDDRAGRARRLGGLCSRAWPPRCTSSSSRRPPMRAASPFTSTPGRGARKGRPRVGSPCKAPSDRVRSMYTRARGDPKRRRVPGRALLSSEVRRNPQNGLFCRYLSPLPDSNRGPPPYHGGFDQPLCDVGKALASALSLHFAWFVCSLHPSLEGP
jgi:hypothetical protein